MRNALLLAMALVPLLIVHAEAQEGPDQGTSDPVQESDTSGVPKPKSIQHGKAKHAKTKRSVIKHAGQRPLDPSDPQVRVAEHRLGYLILPAFGESYPFTQDSNKIWINLPSPFANAVIAPMHAEPRERSDLLKPEPPIAETAAQAIPTADTQARAQAAPTTANVTAIQAGVRIEPVTSAIEPSILIPAERNIGVAAFRSGSDLLVILDAPITLQAPGSNLDKAFAQMSSRRTEDATVIRIPIATGQLRLARNARGWMITVGPPQNSRTSIVPRLITNGSSIDSIQLPAAGTSRVVTVVDPQSGKRLLVGTQSTAGQAVVNSWQQVKFSLLATLQGVAVVATSDDVRLRREADGFTLSTGAQADDPIIPDSEKQYSDAPIAGAVSRLLDIPNGSLAELATEMNERIIAAGEAPDMARSEPRLRVAEAMIALGMDVEAQSVIEVATAADPALLDKPRAIGLRAVAAGLAGRFDDIQTLSDPRLTGSTEIEFWRAYLQVARDEAHAQVAPGLAEGLPILLGYPSSLRDRVLPLTLEAMALNGQAAAAQAALQTMPNDRSLDLARGMVLEMTGDAPAALLEYDRVANRSDRLQRYKAEVRAAELRMKEGELDAKAGADALDRALLAWRGAHQELPLRIRIAALRRQAGQWQEAMTVLRDGRGAFPDEHKDIDQAITETFTALISDDATRTLPVADFVAIWDRNLDIVQEMAWTEQSGMTLVTRLVNLGLQGRAEPVLARLVAQSTDPARRAVLGARLSSLRMTLNDPSGAIAALAKTAPSAGTIMDSATMEARQLLYARAESDRGNKDAALTMLESMGTAKADEARAEIYAARKDWPHVVSALTALEHKAILTPELDETQQAIIMRLAVAATLASDSSSLARIAGTYDSAMAKSSSDMLFRLITSPPVRQKDDLPRAYKEIQLARQLQGSLGGAGSR